jgi:hypothetical protein
MTIIYRKFSAFNFNVNLWIINQHDNIIARTTCNENLMCEIILTSLKSERYRLLVKTNFPRWIRLATVTATINTLKTIHNLYSEIFGDKKTAGGITIQKITFFNSYNAN